MTKPTLAKIESLVPYEKNSRVHSAEQIAQLAKSISEFGMVGAIVTRNGVIAKGHGCLEAIKQIYESGEKLYPAPGRAAGAKPFPINKVPTINANGWTDAQFRAYVIADNQLALNASWDMDLVKLELEELTLDDFDLDTIGFSREELDDIFGADIHGKTDEDDVPEPQKKAKSKLGDIWVLGDHRVMCGDSTSIEAVDALMDGQKADMVFTDPPYGVEYQSNMRTKSAKFDTLANDDSILDITAVLEACSTGWMFIWTSWKVQNIWIDSLNGFGYPTNMIVWHKPGGGLGDLKKTFASDYEVALVWNRGAKLCGKRIGSVWTINKDGAITYKHPTQKPVALAEEAIDKTTKHGTSVLDLFGGSGSTLIACEKTNHHCRMMELDPIYCDVIIKRWQDYTGKEAVHHESNTTFNKTRYHKA